MDTEDGDDMGFWFGGQSNILFFFYQTISFECSEVAVNTEHPGNTYVLILEKSVPCVWAQLSIYCRKPVSKVHWKYMKISIFPSLDME